MAIVVLATAIPAQSPPAFRFTKDLIPAGAGPVLALVDFDLDGDLDLLTNGTGIYLNDGNGVFTPHAVLSPVVAIPYPGCGCASAATTMPVFAIGDLNGDAYPDVLALVPYPSVACQWMNQGNGVLIGTSLGAVFSTGGPTGVTAIRAIALGDVDQDGDLDVVVSRTFSNWFTGGAPQPVPMLLWLNNGAGVFTNAPSPFPPYSPHQLALADLDADGDQDLLTLDVAPNNQWTPTAPMIFFNNGGTFAATGIALPVPAIYDTFAIGNLDLDGIPDLVLDTATWSANAGACATTVPTAPALLVNNSNGTFWQTYSAIAGPMVGAIPRLLDLDGNGQDDLLRITALGAEAYPLTPSTAFGLASWAPIYAALGYFYEIGGGVVSAVGDLDGDGDRDVVVSTTQGNQVLFNDAALTPVAVNGTLAVRQQVALNHLVGAGDVEGDGDQDLMLGFFDCGPGTTRLDVAKGDGAGNLKEGSSLPCPTCPPAAQLGQRLFLDVDGDGDLDAYVANTSPPGIASAHYLLINAGGMLTVAQTIIPATVASYTYCLRHGDLDGDGDQDIVAGMSGNGFPYPFGFRVFLNVGGSYQPGASGASSSYDLELADIDGDGDLDIVLDGYPSGPFLNDGSAGFTPAAPGSMPPALYSVTAGDVDGDGDVDLLRGNVIYLNSGTGTFTAGGSIPFSNYSPNAVGIDFRLLDVDHDGDLDVLDSRGWLYSNLGGGSWSTTTFPRPLTNPIVLSDFDGDADLDLVMQGPAILTNMTRQLSRKVPPRPGRPASLEIGGAPGTVWALYASTGTGNLNLPPLGIVRLALANLQLAATGTVPSGGISVVGGMTPTTPGIVGFSVYWQAVMFESVGPRLTGLEVTTVAAY